LTLRWARALALVALASLALFQLRVLLADSVLKACFIADDGFYYLLPARSFGRLGVWSFDGGLTHSSGFQLLWAYLLVPFSSLNDGAYLSAALALSGLLTAATGWLAWRSCRGSAAALMVLALLASSLNSAHQAVSLLEWPVALLLSGLFLASLWAEDAGRSLGRQAFLGFLLPFGRSDLGMLAGAMAVAAVALALGLAWKARLRAALAGLLGATAGLALVMLHCYLTTGSWMQDSVAIKSFWFSRQGPNAFLPGMVFTDILFGIRYRPGNLSLSGPAHFGLLSAFLSAGAWAFWRWIWPGVNAMGERSALMVLGSALALGGYYAIYTVNPATQLWYSSGQLLAFGILLVAVLSRLSPRARPALFGVLGALTLFNAARLAAFEPRWDEQLPWVRSGLYLRAHPDEVPGPIGAFTCGALGFFAGGTVINLDGLIDHEIVPYTKAGKISCFLAKEHVRCVLDPRAELHRAIDPRDADRSILSAAVLSTRPFPGGEGAGLFLHTLDPAALEKACAGEDLR
jgi:hypothetical protein